MSLSKNKPSWVLAECCRCGYEWIGCGLYRCPSCDSGNLRVKNFFKEEKGGDLK